MFTKLLKSRDRQELLNKLKFRLKKQIPKFWIFIALILTIPAFLPLLKPGYFTMQDDMQAFKIFEMDKCFKDIQIPCRWVPDAGYQYGEPVFNYYPPLPYYLGEILHLSGFQFIDAVKVLFISGFLASTIFMFLLANELFGPFTGTVVSLLFTYSPFRAQQVYVRGSLNEFIALTLTPFILWSFYKLIKAKEFKYIILSSVSLAMILLTHNLLSFIFIPFLLLWITFWLNVQKNTGSKRGIVLSLLAGAGLSAFFILPMLAEKNSVHIDSVLTGYFDYRRHFLSIRQIFLSNNWGYGSSDLGIESDLALNSGLVLILAGFSAFPLSLIFRRKNPKFFLLTSVLTVFGLFILFMMHIKSSFIWEILRPLVWLQFPWRFLSLSVIILTLLTGCFLYYSGRLKYFTGLVLILSVFILHGTFFRPQKWLYITDNDKFSGEMWEKQLTISIFDYLPVSAVLPPTSKAFEQPVATEGKTEILSFKKGSDFQEGVAVSEKETRVVLPIFDFPGMELLIDNKKARYGRDCGFDKVCLGLITFPLPQGRHNFKVELKDTPVRTTGNILSLLTFSMLTFAGLRNKLKHK